MSEQNVGEAPYSTQEQVMAFGIFTEIVAARRIRKSTGAAAPFGTPQLRKEAKFCLKAAREFLKAANPPREEPNLAVATDQVTKSGKAPVSMPWVTG